MYTLDGPYDRALEILLKAKSMNSTPAILNNIAVCYFELRNWGNAASFFLASYNLNKRREIEPLISYGICLTRLGKLTEAKQVAKKLITCLEDPKNYFKEEILKLIYEVNDYSIFIKYHSNTKIDVSFVDVIPFMYSLWIMGDQNKMEQVYSTFLANLEQDINRIQLEEEYVDDEFWMEMIKFNNDEMKECKEAYKQILNGIRPIALYIPTVYSDGYFFGCKRNNIPNYTE